VRLGSKLRDDGEAIVIEAPCAEAFHQPFLLIPLLLCDGENRFPPAENKTSARLPSHRIATSGPILCLRLRHQHESKVTGSVHRHGVNGPFTVANKPSL
jgi:hypothetical protein